MQFLICCMGDLTVGLFLVRAMKPVDCLSRLGLYGGVEWRYCSIALHGAECLTSRLGCFYPCGYSLMYTLRGEWVLEPGWMLWKRQKSLASSRNRKIYRPSSPYNRIPVEARFSSPAQTGPGPHTALLYNGYRVFPGGKERPGRDADPSPLLVPWSRKSRAKPLLPLWAVRPVQKLSTCIMVTFTFTFMYSL